MTLPIFPHSGKLRKSLAKEERINDRTGKGRSEQLGVLCTGGNNACPGVPTMTSGVPSAGIHDSDQGQLQQRSREVAGSDTRRTFLPNSMALPSSARARRDGLCEVPRGPGSGRHSARSGLRSSGVEKILPDWGQRARRYDLKADLREIAQPCDFLEVPLFRSPAELLGAAYCSKVPASARHCSCARST